MGFYNKAFSDQFLYWQNSIFFTVAWFKRAHKHTRTLISVFLSKKSNYIVAYSKLEKNCSFFPKWKLNLIGFAFIGAGKIATDRLLGFERKNHSILWIYKRAKKYLKEMSNELFNAAAVPLKYSVFDGCTSVHKIWSCYIFSDTSAK